MWWSPGRLILVGMVLVILGFLGPLLMVLRLLESTFFLNFASYAASLTGMVMGFVGGVLYVQTHKREQDK